MLQYDVKAKYGLVSRKFSGMKFFHPSVRSESTKSHPRLYVFDKPIKSLYFCSFVVSVLFARFSFKVIRKSLYLITGEIQGTKKLSKVQTCTTDLASYSLTQ